MGIRAFEEKVWLSLPAMHGGELKYMQEAYETNRGRSYISRSYIRDNILGTAQGE